MSYYMSPATSSLANLSQDELKELLQDDFKMDERVQESTKGLEQQKEQLMDENRKIAEENLLKEPELIEKRARINELSEEGVALCSSVQEKLEEIKSKSAGIEEDTIQALLETSAAETEEESEKIVRQFLDKEIAVDAFLESFMDSRKLMHLRKFKADKMRELIRNPRVDGSSVPYPIGGAMMPMPGYNFSPMPHNF